MEKNKSFMKTLKRKGPVIGPCRTPALSSGSHLSKKNLFASIIALQK